MRLISDQVLTDDFDEVMRAVRAGETFEISVEGRPVARIVPVEDDADPPAEAAEDH